MIVLKVKHRLVENKCFAYFCRKFLALCGVDRDADCVFIIVRHRFCFVYTVVCIALFSFVFYHGVDRDEAARRKRCSFEPEIWDSL